MFLDAKPYLAEWSTNVRKDFIENAQSKGLYTVAMDEVTGSRQALAGAKAAKVCLFPLPKLVGVEDEKKTKRDLVRAAREGLKALGVESSYPSEVYQALPALGVFDAMWGKLERGS